MKRIAHDKYLFCFLLFLGLFGASYGQDTTQPRCVDISKINLVRIISNSSSSTFIDRDQRLANIYQQLSFKKGMVHKGSIPHSDVTRKAVVRFQVCNTADSTVSVWFFPGFFFWSVEIYREDNGRLDHLPSIAPPIDDNLGYRKITLAPNDTATYYAELFFVKTYINSMRPRLIHARSIDTFITMARANHDEADMVTYLLCGLLMMMILFSVANFLQGANRDFLYYSAYAFFLGAMLFTKSLYDFRPNAASFFFEGYLDFIMQCIGHGFYLIFMRGFLNTRIYHPFLYKMYNYGIIFLVLAAAVFSYFHFFTYNYVAENLTENSTKIALLIMTIVFLIYSARQWKTKVFRYLFWGNFSLFIFSLLSQASVMVENRFLPGILGSATFYYELGIFLELVFFLAALNYKNRRRIIAETSERERLRTENQMKEYEKEIAVYKAQQEERQRISADMHDELGAGMTAIRLMSEIARNKMKEQTPVEIEKISHSADEVLNKMNAIIWSMNSGNDTLDNLVSYIRSYAIEYFENTMVDCKVNTPPDIEPSELTGDKRRNIFLSVKESLNNTLKHANATYVQIDFEIGDSLVIRIHDNGAGIDLQKLRQFGNGLKNITRRMESIGGEYKIQNERGTLTVLTLPL